MDADTNQSLLVTTIHHEAEGVVSVILEDPDRNDVPAWQPGAHLEVNLPSGSIRQYSLCGDSTNHRRYQVAVLRKPHGRGGSSEIHDTGLVGKVLKIAGPRNRFELVDAPSYLFIAGGIGITPLLAMVRSLTDRGLPWTMAYGGRTRSSMPFTAVLTELAQQRPERATLTFVPQDEQGPLDIESILERAGDDTAIYCCGPGGLITAVEERCARLGISGRLHVERFGAAETQPRAARQPSEDTAAFEVELRRSKATVVVEPGRSILECIRAVVPGQSSSCEEGFCGTCESRVLAGVPEHRDTILNDAERAANDTMFICVSRSLTPKLVLDL